jgi:putative nucleotidyltransferase with HDIG domain
VTGAGFRLSEIVSALSYALDLTEGQPMGHSIRACVIGMRLAQEIKLDPSQQSDLFYALLLKDAGCSSNAARLASLFGADDHLLKRDHKLIDWTRLGPAASYALRHAGGTTLLERMKRVARIAITAEKIGREMIATRCERGADIARMIGLAPATADAIKGLDEHWDGNGHPLGLTGEEIPLFARVLCLAQTFEVFMSKEGRQAAYHMARHRSGTWFDPGLVKALTGFEKEAAFWRILAEGDPAALVEAYEPGDRVVVADEDRVDHVAEAFAVVIDAKSPYTYHHSAGVASIAVQLGARLGLAPVALRELKRAALLHDIGKLGVSNAILDKPGKLTGTEWAAMRLHPALTYEILRRIGRFRDLALVAAAHHERLDGRGYHRGIGAAELDRPARILAVADVCEALQAERPYRKALEWDEIMAIMGRQAGQALCPEVFGVLVESPPVTRQVVDA